MGAIADLWKSERGLVAVVLILAMSTLTALGNFSGAQWLDYTKWIATVYIGSKTVTGAVAMLSAPKEPPDELGVAPAKPPTTRSPFAPPLAPAAPGQETT